jgi:hypothetical protein
LTIEESSKDIVNFYAKKEFRQTTWPKFERICAREHTSRSKKIREFVEAYVKLHDPGNPQQRIDVIAKLGVPYRAGSCVDCGRKPKYEAQIKDVRVFLCEQCLNKRRKWPSTNAKGITCWKELLKK